MEAAGSTKLEAGIKELSKHIGTRWKLLARNLELSATEIEAIEYNNKDLEEQIHQFFQKWKQQQGPNASIQRLIKGLEAARLLKYVSLVQAALRHGTNTNASQGLPSDMQLVRRKLPKKPINSSGISSGQQPDRLQELGKTLFATFPYHIFQNFDNSFVLCIFIVFLLCQFAVILVLGVCEDGGFPTGEDNAYVRIVHGFLLFLVRIGIRVVTPAVFILQLTVLAKVPETPCFGLSEKDAARHEFDVYEKCKYVQRKDLQKMHTHNDHENVFRTAEKSIKRHNWLIWLMVIFNPLLFTSVLFYVGAFHVAEKKPRILDGGFCNFYGWVPGEYVSTFIIILIVGVVKEFYCFENRLSTYGVLIGAQAAAKTLYNTTRNRWKILDWYCYCMPIVLLGVAIVSSNTGKSFMPKTTQDISPVDVISWYVWICILSAIVFFASLSSEFACYTFSCLVPLYTLCAYIIKYEGLMLNIPATGDCSTVFQYIALAILNINLIFTLCRCHYYYYCECKAVLNLCWMVYCVVCIVLLIVCMLLFAMKEVVHLISFQ